MLIELILLGSASYLLGRDKGESNSGQKSFDLKQLFKDVKSVLSGDERQQSLNPGTDLSKEQQKKQQDANNTLLISAGAVTTALLGKVSPPFTVLSAISVLYISRDIFRFIWRDLKAGRIISMFLIGGILVIGMIVSGHLILATIASLIGGIFVKLIEKTENPSKKQSVNIFDNYPSQVWLEKDGVEIQVDFTCIQVGDIIIVNAGDIILVDGQIQDGFATIDQYILTGESQPVEKSAGDKVFAATRLLYGRIRIQVETTGEKTVVVQIGQMLNNTQHYKDKLVARGQKIANTFLPIELGIGAVTWLLRGKGAALTILWSALGANMLFLGPLTVLNYLQILSRRSILVKDGRVLESLHQVDTIIFDKTVLLNQQLGGTLEMHPNIRPEAVEIIHYLKQRGLKLYLISSDQEHSTRRMAETLGINYFAKILPENKAKLVKQLYEQGQFVCFIGDSINDAIALKSAQVSISIEGASTIATDTAQIILRDGTLNHLEQLFQLTDEFEDTMHTNVLTTIVPGVICIGGVYLLHFSMIMGIGVYYVGTTIGLSNTLWPLVKHQDK